MKHILSTQMLLRIGVAFAFAYPAVSAWFSPYSWIGYFPSFMTAIASPHEMVLLHFFGGIELVLAAWILSGKSIRIPSMIAAVMLFLIVAFNLAQMDVLFRDIPILLMALMLALHPSQK